jgi:Pvc16 N-terminal domain
LASFEAIAAVSQAIKRLLDLAPPAGLPRPTVKLYQASDFAGKMEGAGVSLYLYRVAANTNRRNLPPRLGRTGQRLRPPLPLDLFYLLSTWSATVETQHALLGWAMRTLEDTPVLPAALLNAGDFPETFRPEEGVELVYDPLGFADMTTLWDLLKPGVQPSATYVARAVAIDSDVELTESEPVQTRQFDLLTIVERPTGRGDRS